MSKFNFPKLFRKAKDITARGSVVAAWVGSAMGTLPRTPTTDGDALFVTRLTELDADAQAFCGRDLDDGWALHPEWLRHLMAQASNHPRLPYFFGLCGWDFEFYRNPVYLDNTSIFDAGGGVKLLLKSTGHFPVGSWWVNKRNGRVWKLLEAVRGGFEMEPVGFDYSKGNQIRTGPQLNKYFKQIEVK